MLMRSLVCRLYVVAAVLALVACSGAPEQDSTGNLPATSDMGANQGLSEKSRPAREGVSRVTDPTANEVLKRTVDHARFNAWTDPQAADDMTRWSTLCLLLQDTSAPAGRFSAGEWGKVRRLCDSNHLAHFRSNLSNAALDKSSEVELLRLLVDDAGSVSEADRDRLALSVLGNTKVAASAQLAAYTYLNDDRLRNWSDELGGRSTTMSLPTGMDAFRIDAVLYTVCAWGQECGGNSLIALSECAATAGCMPGRSVEQVLRSRRSQHEMTLIESFSQRILAAAGN